MHILSDGGKWATYVCMYVCILVTKWMYICDRIWENPPKRGKQFFLVSPGKALWVDFFRKIFYGRNG